MKNPGVLPGQLSLMIICIRKEYKMNKKISILIVEDEFIIALRMKMELSKMGFIICDTIAKGENAVDFVKIKNPDIVLMDINLQGEMDGIEAAEKILSFSTSAIIFVTGYPDEELRLRAEKLIPAGYFIKPVNIDKIVSVINSVCR